MKKAKGLFRHAIVESGSNVVGRISIEQGTEIAKKILAKLGLDRNSLHRLTEIPSADILEASKDMSPLGIGPVADGINLDYNPSNEFIAPDISSDIPLMVGASEDELAAFIPPDTLNITWDTLKDALLNPSGGILRTLSQNIFTPENVDEIIKVFRDTDRKYNSPAHLYLKIISLSSFLGGGAYHQAMAKAKQGGAPVYHYLISYDAPHPYITGCKFSWHTADLPLQLRIVLHKECEEISRTMARAWAAFVRTGHPSAEGLEWPEFKPDDRKVMVFDDICRVEEDPLKEIRAALERFAK